MRAGWGICAAIGGLWLVGSAQAVHDSTSSALANSEPFAKYADVLDLHATASSGASGTFNAFFDYGAWHGYALKSIPEESLGFVGPLPLTASKTWKARSVAQLE